MARTPTLEPIDLRDPVAPARVAAAPVAPQRPAPRKRAPRPVPQRCPELAHVSLVELRTYRDELAAEENRVSYWRRLVQARLDLLLARSGRSSDLRRLRDVLSQTRGASRRQALLDVAPSEDVPPLPDLLALWSADPDPKDEAERATLVERLSAAEQELSAYRTALHVRIDRATGDLIARYSEDPSSCLVALPSRRSPS